MYIIVPSTHAYSLERTAYVNSLLAILNARTHFQRKLNGHDATVTVSGICFENGVSPGGISSTDVESQELRNENKVGFSGGAESKK